MYEQHTWTLHVHDIVLWI